MAAVPADWPVPAQEARASSAAADMGWLSKVRDFMRTILKLLRIVVNYETLQGCR